MQKELFLVVEKISFFRYVYYCCCCYYYYHYLYYLDKKDTEVLLNPYNFYILKWPRYSCYSQGDYTIVQNVESWSLFQHGAASAELSQNQGLTWISNPTLLYINCLSWKTSLNFMCLQFHLYTKVSMSLCFLI